MQLLKTLVLAVYLVFLPSSAWAEEWLPPAKPKPREILDEARDDAKAKRYSLALAKHVWFHKNALKYEPSLVGVRLSFALSDWMRLGKEYPPALEKLKSIRDALDAKVQSGEDNGREFLDLVAINQYLGDDQRSVESFKAIEKNHPNAAPLVFHSTKNALIKTKEYETYAKYIRGTSDFFAIKDTYERDKKSADRMRDQGKALLEHLDKTFRHETATLVAVLVNVDRKDEANEIADIAEEFIDDEKFLASLKAAREGTVPDPWP
jgi:hypothetical protein